MTRLIDDLPIARELLAGVAAPRATVGHAIAAADGVGGIADPRAEEAEALSHRVASFHVDAPTIRARGTEVAGPARPGPPTARSCPVAGPRSKRLKRSISVAKVCERLGLRRGLTPDLADPQLRHDPRARDAGA